MPESSNAKNNLLVTLHHKKGSLPGHPTQTIASQRVTIQRKKSFHVKTDLALSNLYRTI